MFKVREREYTNRSRQLLDLMEFTVSNDDIPLKQNWNERWYSLTRGFQDVLPQILNMEVRNDDVFVVTYMKCGTTWMQETAWLLQNNLDFERAKKINLNDRSPFIDWCGVFKHCSDSVEVIDRAPSPRLIKSHLPPNMLPKQIWQKKSKIIFVARNIKDTVVSAFHFHNDMGAWKGTMDEFAEDFMHDEAIYLPFWTRVIDFWRMRHEPNICFVTYEDMKRDLAAVIQRLCTFLGRPQLTSEQMLQAVDHLSFNKMKGNKQANISGILTEVMSPALDVRQDFEFMRRGIIGSYKDELTPERQRKLDEWSNEILAEYDLTQEDIFGKF